MCRSAISRSRTADAARAATAGWAAEGGAGLGGAIFVGSGVYYGGVVPGSGASIAAQGVQVPDGSLVACLFPTIRLSEARSAVFSRPVRRRRWRHGRERIHRWRRIAEVVEAVDWRNGANGAGGTDNDGSAGASCQVGAVGGADLSAGSGGSGGGGDGGDGGANGGGGGGGGAGAGFTSPGRAVEAAWGEPRLFQQLTLHLTRVAGMAASAVVEGFQLTEDAGQGVMAALAVGSPGSFAVGRWWRRRLWRRSAGIFQRRERRFRRVWRQRATASGETGNDSAGRRPGRGRGRSSSWKELMLRSRMEVSPATPHRRLGRR